MAGSDIKSAGVIALSTPVKVRVPVFIVVLVSVLVAPGIERGEHGEAMPLQRVAGAIIEKGTRRRGCNHEAMATMSV